MRQQQLRRSRGRGTGGGGVGGNKGGEGVRGNCIFTIFYLVVIGAQPNICTESELYLDLV